MRRIGDQHVAHAAFRGFQRDLEGDPLTGQRARHPRRALAIDVFRHRLFGGLADHGGTVDAHHRFIGTVGEEVATLLVEVGDQRRHVVGVDADVVFRADQRLFGALLLGDVLIGVDEAATGHRVALDLHHAVILAIAHVAVRLAVADGIQQLVDVLFGVARAVFAVVGVVAEDAIDGRADPDQVVREAEHVQVALVPHHQAHVLVDHADALVDVLDGRLQQGAVEFEHLRGFIDDGDDIRDADAATLQRRVDDDACRGGTEHRGQEAFGELDQVDGGACMQLQRLAAAARVVLEGALDLLVAQEAFAQDAQVRDGGGAGPGARDAGLAGLDTVDEQRGLDALDHALRRHLRDEDVAEQVQAERQHHAVGQRVIEAEAEQAMRRQPVDAQRPMVDDLGRHQTRLCQCRHEQGPGPDREADIQADDDAEAVATLPVEATHQRGRELGDGGKRQQADGREGAVFGDQQIEAVGQRQDHHDGQTARQQHDMAVVACLGIEPAQAEQQRNHDLVGDHDRDRDGGDDHHAGGGGEAADEGQQGQPGLVRRHRQCQHEAVR